VRKFFTSLFAFILPGIMAIVIRWLFVRWQVRQALAGAG
jgi:hypothetical protein